MINTQTNTPSALASTSIPTSAQSILRRSCIFCRARKIRCSGGHICNACRERNANCVYSPEARKGRPKHKGSVTSNRRRLSSPPAGPGDIELPSTASSPKAHSDGDSGADAGAVQAQRNNTPDGESALCTGQTLGEDLEQMFDEYFIRKSGSRSNLFQNSIASFQRHVQGPGNGGSSPFHSSTMSYDGMLSVLANEMVEMLVVRFGQLGCEQPDSGTRNFYITSLAADTTPAMFDSPLQPTNLIFAIGRHRIMQLVDVWFFTHPLSPLISKTLLISGIRDETVDEALLAIVLADACQLHRDANGSAGDDSDSNGDHENPELLARLAATLLRHRPVMCEDPATLSTAQALILLGWRELCQRNARRGTCYIGYTCRVVSRLNKRWGKDGRGSSMKLNGVDIGTVEKEIVQNIYWVCLSTTTWSFMQIDQPFMLLVPDELPGFPGMDETTSAILRLDRTSNNISTLQSQIQTMRWLWPLSHITSTVAHIYSLYLSAATKDKETHAAPWQTRHIYQLHHLLQSRFRPSTLSLEIQGILIQAIQVMESEVTNTSSQSFLLVAYHAIVVHILFSPDKAAQKSLQISPSVINTFCHSASALLALAQQLPSHPENLVERHRRPDGAASMALALDTCSRALVYIYQQFEAAFMDDHVAKEMMRDQLKTYADQMHQICKLEWIGQSGFVIRATKKRFKQVKHAFESQESSNSMQLVQPSAAEGSRCASPTPGSVLDCNQQTEMQLHHSSSASSLPILIPGAPALGMHQSPHSAIDSSFFMGDLFMDSLLRFPVFNKPNPNINPLLQDMSASYQHPFPGGNYTSDLNRGQTNSSSPDEPRTTHIDTEMSTSGDPETFGLLHLSDSTTATTQHPWEWDSRGAPELF